MIGFFHEDRDACIGEDHGDAAAHCACAYYCCAVYWDELGFFGNVGDFGYFAIAEENVDHGFGLIGEEAIHEKFALGFAAFFEGLLGGGFYGFDGGLRGHHAALFFSGGVAGGGEDGCVLFWRA